MSDQSEILRLTEENTRYREAVKKFLVSAKSYEDSNGSSLWVDALDALFPARNIRETFQIDDAIQKYGPDIPWDFHDDEMARTWKEIEKVMGVRRDG